mgnify:CR=1 FL=1
MQSSRSRYVSDVTSRLRHSIPATSSADPRERTRDLKEGQTSCLLQQASFNNNARNVTAGSETEETEESYIHQSSESNENKENGEFHLCTSSNKSGTSLEEVRQQYSRDILKP